MHAHVVGQSLGFEVIEVVEPWVRAPHAGADRRIEALLELGLAPRRVQRKRGNDLQLDGGITARPLIECIEQSVGFSNPQRRAQHDAFTEPFEDGLDARIAVSKTRWLQASWS